MNCLYGGGGCWRGAAATLLLVVTTMVSSFNVRTLSTTLTLTHSHHNALLISTRRRMDGHIRPRPVGSRIVALSSSWNDNNPFQDNSSNNEGEDKDGDDNLVDELSEFLTRRQGRSNSNEDRKRKRDRIRDWMSSSSSSSNKSDASSAYVQPIAQDGSALQVPDDDRRTQARFDKLFAGMPSLEDILSSSSSSSSSSSEEQSDTTPSVSSSSGKSPLEDDSWFDEEKRRIENEYSTILEQTKAQLAEERQQNPDGIPDNAEGVVESIIRQEQKRMIASVKTVRAKERLQEYQINRMSDIRRGDYGGTSDDLVKELLKQAGEDWDRQEALEAERNSFRQYQESAYYQQQLQQQQDQDRDNNLQQPKSDDLDSWALERLEDMLAQSQSSDDEGGISDILEQNIDDLRDRIDKEAKKGSIQPQTMKEWQMYRAIATRLSSENNAEEEDENAISSQLESWKQYIGKEEDIRKRSGLALGPKMPFEWQRAGSDPMDVLEPPPKPKAISKKERREARREANIKAVQAMEDLVQKADSARAENLRIQLEALKAELEPRDYYDIEVELSEEDEEILPVDFSGVFQTSDQESGDIPEERQREEEYSYASYQESLSSNYSEETPSDFSYLSQATSRTSAGGGETKPPPPQTPFFSDSDYEEQDEEEKIEPPETPFFAEAGGGSSSPESSSGDSKLGSIEEQKLQAMYRRAGARTAEEQAKIKEQWESFQMFEKERRDESGLSDYRETDDIDTSNLKYDISEVMKDGGDFDAEKILSSIGPRPTRRKASGSSSDLDPSEVSESLYRSVAAVGGGRVKDDPSLKEREKADFEEYIQKENEMRDNLDDLDESLEEQARNVDPNVDDETYAEEALSAIGPRPIFKRKMRYDEGEYSDMGGALASSDNPDDDDDESDELDDVGLIPEWLQKERQESQPTGGDAPRRDIGSSFLGSDIDEVFDDDKYDHNMRQLAEYERRRRGERGQMGIDISDVLGRRDSDDYADYNFDDQYTRSMRGGWGDTSFSARKENLMGYTELTAPELNNLMDFKGSVYTTGVSQYMPRINKPFKEFGAVFRLEGVLIDSLGLEHRAWAKVAEAFGFKKPLVDDVKRAAVVRPEIAVRQVFYWTNDMNECQSVVDAHQEAVQEVFDTWAKENGISAQLLDDSSATETGSMAIGDEGVDPSIPVSPKLPQNEEDRAKLLVEAWSRTATESGYVAPPLETIIQCAILTPEIAIRDGFRWTFDSTEIDMIAKRFNGILQELTGSAAEASTQNSASASAASSPGHQQGVTENDFLELQYRAWSKVAKEFKFTPPSEEEVVAASVLNDPETVISSGFGWTNDPIHRKEIAAMFSNALAEFVNERFHGRSYTPVTQKETVVTATSSSPSQTRTASGPSAEEILETQLEAWRETAARHNFQAPSSDQVELTMNLEATEAVTQLLAWTYNFNGDQIKAISETYEEALRESSQKYIKKYALKSEVAQKTPQPKAAQSSGPTGDELFQAAKDAWTTVAWKSNYSLPDDEQVIFAMTVGPEEAIMVGFEWSRDREEVQKIASQYKEQIKIKLTEWQGRGSGGSSQPEATKEAGSIVDIPVFRAIPGTAEWIKSLRDVEMECSVVSYLSDEQVDVVLQYIGLSDLLPRSKRVTSTDGYDRASMQVLGAALRMERRPDHCVVFDTSPQATTSAHEVEMRSVSIVGPYPRYELLSADSSIINFGEMTAMNIRRLFGERVYDQPMLDQQQAAPENTKKTSTLTRFWDDE